jgi:hypothetical protein
MLPQTVQGQNEARISRIGVILGIHDQGPDPVSEVLRVGEAEAWGYRQSALGSLSSERFTAVGVVPQGTAKPLWVRDTTHRTCPVVCPLHDVSA